VGDALYVSVPATFEWACPGAKLNPTDRSMAPVKQWEPVQSLEEALNRAAQNPVEHFREYANIRVHYKGEKDVNEFRKTNKKYGLCWVKLGTVDVFIPPSGFCILNSMLQIYKEPTATDDYLRTYLHQEFLGGSPNTPEYIYSRMNLPWRVTVDLDGPAQDHPYLCAVRLGHVQHCIAVLPAACHKLPWASFLYNGVE